MFTLLLGKGPMANFGTHRKSSRSFEVGIFDMWRLGKIVRVLQDAAVQHRSPFSEPRGMQAGGALLCRRVPKSGQYSPQWDNTLFQCFRCWQKAGSMHTLSFWIHDDGLGRLYSRHCYLIGSRPDETSGFEDSGLNRF